MNLHTQLLVSVVAVAMLALSGCTNTGPIVSGDAQSLTAVVSPEGDALFIEGLAELMVPSDQVVLRIANRKLPVQLVRDFATDPHGDVVDFEFAIVELNTAASAALVEDNVPATVELRVGEEYEEIAALAFLQAEANVPGDS